MSDVRHVEFDVDLERVDYRRVAFNNVMGKNKFALFGMAAMFVISAGYLILDAVGKIESTNFLKLLAAAFIVLDLGLLCFVRFIAKRLNKLDFQHMGAKRHMTIAEDCVISEAADEEKSKEFEWDTLYNGEECGKHFLMFSTTGLLVLLPKRFMTAEQIPQIRKILKVMMQEKFKTK